MINDIPPEDMIDAAIQARLFDLMTCLPGVVQAYDAAAQTADVLPVTGTIQDGVAVAMPVLPDVPVAFPRFGGGSITWPLAKGDPVILLFASRAIDAYVQDGIEGDPQSARAQHLTDAIAVPMGLTPAASRIAGASATDVRFVPKTGGKLRLAPDSGTAGAARTGDDTSTPVPAAWATFATQVAGFINDLVPDTVTPIVPTNWPGEITTGSATVTVGD